MNRPRLGVLLPFVLLGILPGDLSPEAMPPLHALPSLPTEIARPGVRTRLVTNEYAHHHPDAPGASRSPVWIATSGTLFQTGRLLWSGRPDDRSPGRDSVTGTDSAVLRAVSRRSDVGAAGVLAIRFAAYTAALVSTPRTPARDFDGIHLLLRYHSPRQLYAVSVLRRDGVVAIKKKSPGGPSNGGRYVTLAVAGGGRGRAAGIGRWLRVDVLVTGTRIGAGGGAGAGSRSGVRIVLRLDGRVRLVAVDDGVPDPAIRAGGRFGLRGDNCDFYIRDLTVGKP